MKEKKVLSGTWDSDMHLVFFSFLKSEAIRVFNVKGTLWAGDYKQNYLLFRVILNLFLIRPHTLKTGQTVKTQWGFSVFKGLNVVTQLKTVIKFAYVVY